MFRRIKRFIAYALTKAASFFSGEVKAPGRFVIEFDFYDSDFRHVLVEYFDASVRRFVKCALVGSKNTFKWRRSRVCVELDASSRRIGPEFIIKLTRPESAGAHPFVFSRICLKAAAPDEDDCEAREVSRFEPSDCGVKMGFYGPYVFSSRKVFSINCAGCGRPAYFVFDGVHEGLRSAGFDFNMAGDSAAASVIDLFISGSGGCGRQTRAGADFEKKPEPETAVGPVPEKAVAPEDIEVKPGERVTQCIKPETDAPNDKDMLKDKGTEQNISLKAENETDNKAENKAENETDNKAENETDNKAENKAENETEKKRPAGHIRVGFFSDGPWEEMLGRLSPKFVKTIIERADGIVAGEYEHNGTYFKVGEEIDWHADFNYSKWPARESLSDMAAAFYSSLENGPAAGEGVWPRSMQLAKNNEWIYLALAVRMTGADKYAQKMIALFKSFNAANDAGLGINFVSDAVCAERLVSWLLAFELIEAQYGTVFKSIGFHDIFSRHFDHLYERVVNRPDETRRHERIISLACVYGILLQLGGRVAPAVTKVFKKLKEEVAGQFTSDGAHASGSPVYQLAVYKALIYAVVLSKKSSNALANFAPNSLYEDAEFMRRFERMSRFLAAMAGPSGELPCIGDHYFYFFLPFDETSPLDARPSLQMASFLLTDGELKYLTGESKIAEIAMSFGEDGVCRYNALRVVVPDKAPSFFPDAGYFTLRLPVNSLGKSNQATHFIFDAGGAGDSRESVKGFEFLTHNDLHNFILSHGGACFIGDSGPALFIKNGDIFRYKRTPAAHNALILNKTHCPRFAEYGLPENFKRFEDGRVFLVSSTHKGYLSADMEALVRRTVLIVDGDYMLIMDDVFNGRKKPYYFDVDVIFHSPPDITIESAATVNHKQLLVYNSRGSEAKLINLTHSAQKLSSGVYRACVDPFAGWHSDAAAQVNESVSVIHSARFAKLPVRIYNLFYFVKSGDSPSALLKKLRFNLNKLTASIEISHRDYKDSIKINEKFEVVFNRGVIKV